MYFAIPLNIFFPWPGWQEGEEGDRTREVIVTVIEQVSRVEKGTELYGAWQEGTELPALTSAQPPWLQLHAEHCPNLFKPTSTCRSIYKGKLAKPVFRCCRTHRAWLFALSNQSQALRHASGLEPGKRFTWAFIWKHKRIRLLYSPLISCYHLLWHHCQDVSLLVLSLSSKWDGMLPFWLTAEVPRGSKMCPLLIRCALV